MIAGEQQDNPRLRVLLFPSIERAKTCDLRLAVELTPMSEKTAEKIPRAGYWLVSIAGYFQRHPNGLPEPFSGGHWADIAIASEPMLLAKIGDDSEPNCISQPLLFLPGYQANGTERNPVPHLANSVTGCMPWHYYTEIGWLGLFF